jgi:lysophospholipase L1-like esterase
MLAALACVPNSGEAAPAVDEAPVRILLVGDSVTQGSAGDWTWRYRLAQHLESLGTEFEFVGPRASLFDNTIGQQTGSTDYVDPDFDQDHAALWGMTAAFAEPIGHWVELYEPDVVVEMLGVNDLDPFWHSTPQAAAGDVADFVGDARAADPGVDVVVAHATQTWRQGVQELNTRLTAVVADLDGPESRVVLAEPDVGYDRDQDTWDGTHPDSWGEVKIAAAVADSLAELGIGAPVVTPLPTPPRGPRIPSTLLAAEAGDGEVALSWTASPGAPKTQITVRDLTLGTPPQVLTTVQGTAHLATGLTNGHYLEFSVLPVKGAWVAAPDVDSNHLTARPRPALPGAVGAVTAGGVDHGVRVDWEPAPWADSYVVWWRDAAGGGWASRREATTSTVIKDLVAGATYDVAVQPVGRAGLGDRTDPEEAVPTGPSPTAPAVNVTVDGGGEATITWTPVVFATSYRVEWRSVTEPQWQSIPAEFQLGTSALVRGLRSRASFVVRVRADHQLVPGTFAAPVAFEVPAVAAVARVRAHRHGARHVRTAGDAVPFATAYELATVVVRHCRNLPAATRFRGRGVLALPQATVRARGAAVWVRWVAVRDGVEGDLAASSTACVLLHR